MKVINSVFIGIIKKDRTLRVLAFNIDAKGKTTRHVGPELDMRSGTYWFKHVADGVLAGLDIDLLLGEANMVMDGKTDFGESTMLAGVHRDVNAAYSGVMNAKGVLDDVKLLEAGPRWIVNQTATIEFGKKVLIPLFNETTH